MIIYPAIDLRQGRCVRLRQGNPDQETVFGEDPVAMAQHWVGQGAEWLHVVNLDGAFSKRTAPLQAAGQPSSMVSRLDNPDDPLLLPKLPVNLERLKQIRKAVSVPIQFGGGVRTLEDVELVLSLGADRVILGTVAVKQPELVRRAVKRWGPEQIVVGIDAKDGKVAIHGWQEVSHMDAVDLAHHMKCCGVRRVVYTDISRDGMLAGVNVQSTANLGDMTDLMVIASGGVAGAYDIRQLKRHEHYNIEGVVVGQALYTGALDLPRAIDIGSGPLIRRSAGFVPYLQMEDGIKLLLLWNSFFEQWQFPRGGVEEEETDLECAHREFSEETGLSVANLHRGTRTTLNYVARIRHYDVEREVVYYLAEAGAEETVLGHDNHSEFRWVSPTQAKLMLMDTSPEQLPALEMAMAYFNGHQT